MEKFDVLLFEQQYKNGRCVIETKDGTVGMYEKDDYYIVQSEQADPGMLCSMKLYDADTLDLFQEGLWLKHGSTRIGVWKLYDLDGEVLEEVDYDQGWNITWEKLVPFIQAQGIRLEGISGISRSENKKNEREGESASDVERIWNIRLMTMSDQAIEYHFSGDTGALIDKTTTQL